MVSLNYQLRKTRDVKSVGSRRERGSKQIANEIFGTHAKSESPSNASSGSPTEHQKRVARIVDMDKWTQGTNQLRTEYKRAASQPYVEGEYAGQKDLLNAIRGGKVFIFRAGDDLRVITFLSLACAAIFLAISLSGLLPSIQNSIIFFVICFIPTLLIGVVFLVKTMMSFLVVGPKGVVWRGGGILWEDIKSMNTSAKTVNTRFGPRQKYALWFELWDGTARRIVLHHRTKESPGTPPNQFISQVVKTTSDVHGRITSDD